MRNLTLKGKIVIFKTTISKVDFQSFIATVLWLIVSKLEKIQNAFFSKNSTHKIKHETFCNDYKAVGLKNVDIPNKIISLQCSWIKRLYEKSFHEWELIPLYLIEKSFGTPIEFHSNLLLIFWTGKKYCNNEKKPLFIVYRKIKWNQLCYATF